MKKVIFLLLCLPTASFAQSVMDTTVIIPAKAFNNPAAALRIGNYNDPGNVWVPVGGSTGGYNLDFLTWRDIKPNQVGARIRAERINLYQANNAMVQGMDLAFSTSRGDEEAVLYEQMRLTRDGNLGIGVVEPASKLHVGGNIICEANTELGGSLNLINLTKSGNDIAKQWTIYNMGANHGNSLQFWAYDNRGCSAGGMCQARFTILDDGRVGVGTTTPREMLEVAGSIRSTRVIVKQKDWADFVFQSDYKLPPLQSLKAFIKEKGHLPEIPTEKEIVENGQDLAEIQKKQMQKIEELTLYIIQQQEQIERLAKEVKELRENNSK